MTNSFCRNTRIASLAASALLMQVKLFAIDVRITSEISITTTPPDVNSQQVNVSHVVRTFYKGDKARVDYSEGMSYIYDFGSAHVYTFDTVKKTYSTKTLKEFMATIEPEALSSLVRLKPTALKESLSLDIKKNSVLAVRTLVGKDATPYDLMSNATFKPEPPVQRQQRSGFPGGGGRRRGGGGFPFPPSNQILESGNPQQQDRFAQRKTASTDIDGEIWLTNAIALPSKTKHPLLPILFTALPYGSIADATAEKIEKLKGFPAAMKTTYTRNVYEGSPTTQVININFEVKVVDESPIDDDVFKIPGDFSRGN